MKLLSCDGRLLEVRDCGPVVFRLAARPGGPPIRVNGKFVMEDDAMRDQLRALLALGLYDGGRT